MVEGSFETFFLASAGAGGAFVGLLFIALSIAPQRTFDPMSVVGMQQQRLAEATLLTLFNGFVVSCMALVPGVNVGWISLVLGVTGMLIAGKLVGFLARSHRHEVAGGPSWLHRLRVVSLSIVATLLYAVEGLLGLRLILRPHDDEALRWLAEVIIVLYALGILRAWTLLGNPRHGWSGWLNPWQDLEFGLEATRETVGTSQADIAPGNAANESRQRRE